MRGAGAAVGASARGQPARDANEIQTLREELLRLEQQLHEIKRRLDTLESGTEPQPELVEPVSPTSLDRSIRDALAYGFNLAGVIALALAIALVASFSFGKGSGASLASVAAGCGGLLLLAGLFRRRGVLRLALWLEGAAVGVGFLSAYAAFELWQSLGVALLFATVVAALAVAVSLLRGSQAIAVFAVYGAVLTPLLMRNAAPRPGDQSPALLFAYLALLNLSTLFISRYRYWPWQAASSLLATHFLAWFWFAQYRESSPVLTLVFPCVTFVAFFLRPLVRVRPAQWHDKGILVANTLLFLAALQTLLFAYAPRLLPFSPAVLGLAHGAAAWLFAAGCALAPTHLTMLALLLVPGAWLASPAIAPLVWIGVALLLGWLGLRHDRWVARMAGYALIAAAMGFAPRAYVVLPAALAGAWYVRRAREQMPQAGDLEWLARWGLLVAMVVGGLAASTMEARALLALPALSGLASGSHFIYSLCIAAYGAAIALWGRARRSSFLRNCALLVFAVLTAKVFLFDLAALAGVWRIGSLMLLACSLLAVSASRR